MNFDFSEDQRLLSKSVRDYLEDHDCLRMARAVLESDATHSVELWKAAGQLGWLGAAIPEEYGGGGYGHLELALIAEELGRGLAPVPFASSVCLAAEALLLAGSRAQKERYLPKLASGELIGTLALHEGPGRPAAEPLRARFEDGRMYGTKLPVMDGLAATIAIVVAKGPLGVALALVDLSAEGVSRSPLGCVDPSRSLARLEFSGAPAEPLGEPGEGSALLERLLDGAAVLAAFEQLGGAASAFDLTLDYCKRRFAFGRAIASFQALKHRMADIFVELELARSNACWGAWALETGSEELGAAACAARSSASEAFELAATEMIQMHGGVGYTWEFDCHLFYRRAKFTSLALGGAAEWREKLVSRLDTSGSPSAARRPQMSLQEPKES